MSRSNLTMLVLGVIVVVGLLVGMRLVERQGSQHAGQIQKGPADDVTVDGHWYLAQYPDVRAAVEKKQFKSAQDHYRSRGYLERRLPAKPTVDEDWYLQKYPDVASAIKNGTFASAFDHFVKAGYREGRAPSSQLGETKSASSHAVDEAWYLSQYPDVRAAIERGIFKSGSDHYRTNGQAEKRLPSRPIVDEAWYLRTYPEVADAIRQGKFADAVDHFVRAGYAEGRRPR